MSNRLRSRPHPYKQRSQSRTGRRRSITTSLLKDYDDIADRRKNETVRCGSIKHANRRCNSCGRNANRTMLQKTVSKIVTDNIPPMLYQNLTLHDLHTVFRQHPDLEQKYLNMMKMPITGKESIQLPFNFHSHRQHTCLDISPYGNEQVSKSACIACRENIHVPTASDSMVAFINQHTSIMRHRKFYYGFRKDTDLIKMSGNQPQLFQIYFIVEASVPDVVPLIYARNCMLHMYLIFERQDIHIPCDCINQTLAVARDHYAVSLDILHGYAVITVMCQRVTHAPLKIDVGILQRKVDELEIPNDINERFERYRILIDDVRTNG